MWSKSKIVIIALLGLVILILLWALNQYQYQTLDVYTCDERREYVIPRQNLLPQDMLELYVGGWIEKGEVAISGFPSRGNEALKFSRGDSVGTISHAYIGEYYEPDINILFQPSEGASCLIRVIYKYKWLLDAPYNHLINRTENTSVLNWKVKSIIAVVHASSRRRQL